VPASLVACRFTSLKYAGTVITALVIFSPRYVPASLFSFCRMNALVCWEIKPLPVDSDGPVAA
jgi:hypothetical protein